MTSNMDDRGGTTGDVRIDSAHQSYELNNDSLTHSLTYVSSESDEEPEPEYVASEHIPEAGTSSMTWTARVKKAGSSMISRWKPKTTMKQKLWSTWNNMLYSGHWMTSSKGEYEDQDHIVLLGRTYSPSRTDGGGSGFTDFFFDYYSRIWFTYRNKFAAFPGTNVTSDCGWGCMIRTTQMMIAQGIVLNRLKRDWRYISPSVAKKADPPVIVNDVFFEAQREILKLFEDIPLPSAPFGIHRLMEIAKRFLNTDDVIERWYTPNEMLSLVKIALRESESPLTSDLSILNSVDGRITLGDAEMESRNWTKKLLIFVTLRLGTTDINKAYYEHIRFILSLPNCLGITGGKPDHSLYFIGHYGKNLIYLDPHVAHDYAPVTNVLAEESEEDGNEESTKIKKRHPFSSFHCKLLSKMSFSDMDPSCAVGFLVNGRMEFDHMVKQLNLHQVIDVELGEDGSKRTRDPLFTVLYGEVPEYRRETEITEEERAQAREHGFELL